MDHMLDKDGCSFPRRSCTGGWRRSPPDRPGLRGEEPLLVSVWGGSFVFMADPGAPDPPALHRGLHGGVLYGAGTASSGQVRIIKDLSEHIEGAAT